MAMKPYVPESLPLQSLDWKRFLRLIGPANAALARYDGILQAMINPAVLLSPLTTQEAVLSSRIEGTEATLEEVLEFDAKNEDLEANQDIHEIINYRSAIRAAVDSLRTRPICLNFFKEIHAILLDSVRGRDKARGEFRREQVFIGAPRSKIEQATFVPPEPLSLEKHLRNLESYIHYDEQDRLVQLAVFHAQFELIHPFLDGNGRVGRILMPLFLYEKQLLSSPMFYLSAYLEAHRDEYYDRLEAISRHHDWEGWIEFFLRAVVEQAAINTAKAKAILDLYQAKKIKVAGLTHSEYAIHTVDALFFKPVFRSTDFVKRTQMPQRTAIRTLNRLVEEGILEIIEVQRGRRPATYLFRKLIAITEGWDDADFV